MDMSASLSMALLLFGLSGPAHTQPKTVAPYATMAPVAQYLMADRDAEIALARTAAPPSISGQADVLVLGPRGYVRAVKGVNGFVCFVERSWTGSLFNFSEFWNPKLRAPNCFNPGAVRTELPQIEARTDWALAGASKRQMIERTKAAFASHRFRNPEAGAFSFMLSRQGDLGDQANGGPWLPHVMLFVPYGQTAPWAAGKDGSPVLGADTNPLESTTLFIPVRRWSDGSPAPPVVSPHKM
jgi:hypothetical protein